MIFQGVTNKCRLNIVLIYLKSLVQNTYLQLFVQFKENIFVAKAHNFCKTLQCWSVFCNFYKKLVEITKQGKFPTAWNNYAADLLKVIETVKTVQKEKLKNF